MGNPGLEGDVRMEILVIAYVLTGVRKVVKGFRLPFHDQPTYVRRRMYGMIVLMVLGWALVDAGYVLSEHWRNPTIRREALSNFLTFAILVALGFAFL